MTTITVNPSTCSVCSGLAEDNMMIRMGDLYESARTVACEGCMFLYGVSQQVHDSIFGKPLQPEQLVFVNYGMMFPPKVFLILPRGNVLHQSGKIEVFKTPLLGSFCPWPSIKEATLTSGDTGSKECHSTVANWLKECESSHGTCRLIEEPCLPTRVLDIGEESSAQPFTVSLLETGVHQRGKYCCLSHRWIDGDTPTTTESNLAERKKNIDFEGLPPKYQDAITFARTLGIRYLWIDSLCILQEGSPDWLTEAPRMAEYYGNAFLTVSASHATEKDQRCFSKSTSITPTIKIANGADILYAVHYRLPLSHTENPLHSRGWVFQEYMLSRRVVHFLSEEVIWECREATWCECGRVSDDFTGTLLIEPISTSAHQSFAYRKKARFYKSLSSPATTPTRLKNLWMEIVNEYTRKNLTFGADVFPALAGFAKAMQVCRGCEYYAGLWEDSFVSDLLWKSEDEEWYPVGHEYLKPATWRAPSWSWASSTAIINWPNCPHDSATGQFSEIDLIADVYISDMDVDYQTVGEDATMGVKSATLFLTGEISDVPIVLDEGKGYEVSSYEVQCSLSLDHRMTGGELVEPELLRAVLVARIGIGPGDGQFVSLVLKPTGVEADQYERIGVLYHNERLERTQRGVKITIV